MELLPGYKYSILIVMDTGIVRPKPCASVFSHIPTYTCYVVYGKDPLKKIQSIS